MQREITLYTKNIEYTLRVSKRARRMRLSIYGDGSFVVTAPKKMSEDHIERFIIQKSRWIIKKLKYVKNFPPLYSIRSRKKDFEKYKQQALLFAKKRVAYFNTIYNFKFNTITIKDQKTRWGSCSRKGSLNFNYKIALLPERLADYIIVHELCHLDEFNHSSKFWTLVERAIPDHREIRKMIKKGGVALV